MTRIPNYILLEIRNELERCEKQHGDQTGKSLAQMFAILAEEFGEAAKEVCKIVHGESRGRELREELVQTAAMAVLFLHVGDVNDWWESSIDVLSCDCYPGCWGDHAAQRAWPAVVVASAPRAAWKFCVDTMQYGSYVRMNSNLIRVSSRKAAQRLLDFLIAEGRD